MEVKWINHPNVQEEKGSCFEWQKKTNQFSNYYRPSKKYVTKKYFDPFRSYL